MNRWVCFALLAALVLPLSASADKGPNLGKGYDLTLGDAIARRVADLLSLRPEFENVPVVATYDRGAKVIELTIAGSKTDVAQAKSALEKLGKILEESVLPRVKKGFGVELEEGDFTFVYMNRKAGKEVVRRENGKYLVP